MARLVDADDGGAKFRRPRLGRARDVRSLRRVACPAVGSQRVGGGKAHYAWPRAAFRPPSAAWRAYGDRRETFAPPRRVLKATRLSVDGEFLHGVPASRMESGLWSGTSCASKSGAFGEPDWLLKHLC